MINDKLQMTNNTGAIINITISPIAKIGLVLMIMAGLWASQPATAATGNIDTSDKYAWSENTGYQNYRPGDGGVTVYGTYLTGYVWAENIGYIKLGNDNGGSYNNTSSSDWGVNNDGSGNLSGYAWSENVGWINFNPSNSQVTIGTADGEFDGYAWAENIGWIHFNNTSPAYNVVTTYTDSSSSTNEPDITVTDSLSPTTDLSLPYGTVTTGSSSDQKVIVTNDGTEDLTITDIAQSNPIADPFSIIADNCSNKTLPAGGSCNIYVSFSPTAAGTFNDSFDIPSNDSDESTVTFSVSGTGTEDDVPDITVTDSIAPKNDLDAPFGTVTVDSSSDSVVTVINDGSTYLV